MQIEIKENVKLSNYSTFKIGGLAKFFLVVKNKEELLYALAWAKKKSLEVLIVGGGSNMVFSDKDFNGLVVKNEISGIELVGENNDFAILKAYSGENWSKFVYFSIQRNYYGLENLFYIPGTVGASPIQNIGAYGAELKDVFYNLCAIDLKSFKTVYFNLKDCDFSYRNSVFKNKLKGKYFILWINVKLKKQADLKIDYGNIKDSLLEKGIKNPTLLELTKTIQEIRDSKLPNPSVLPNTGSFFKNPVVNSDFFSKLQERFPEIKSFPDPNGVKIPAGWLIEEIGLKGYRYKNVGVYEKQALILVNYGDSSQADLLFLIKLIKDKVFDTFGISLEEEVNILN